MLLAVIKQTIGAVEHKTRQRISWRRGNTLGAVVVVLNVAVVVSAKEKGLPVKVAVEYSEVRIRKTIWALR